jgi:hypothetical protein
MEPSHGKNVSGDGLGSIYTANKDSASVSTIQLSKDQVAHFQQTGNAIRAALPVISSWPWTTTVLLENGTLLDAVRRHMDHQPLDQVQESFSQMVLVSIIHISLVGNTLTM